MFLFSPDMLFAHGLVSSIVIAINRVRHGGWPLLIEAGEGASLTLAHLLFLQMWLLILFLPAQSSWVILDKVGGKEGVGVGEDGCAEIGELGGRKKKSGLVGEDGWEGSGEVRGDRENQSRSIGEDDHEGSEEVRGEFENIFLAWCATLSLSSSP